MSYSNNNTVFCNLLKHLVALFPKLPRFLSNKVNFSCKVEEAINRQICAEQQAAQEYLCIAVLFLHPNISRPGVGSYFMKMHHEELSHMQKFIHYQIMRGGMPIIKGINEPSGLENITLLSAFKQAFTIEDSVTQLLEKLVAAADSVNDYQCSDFVTSVFLQEQRLALSELAHHITKISRFGSDEHALYNYDLHLANYTIPKIEHK